MSIQTIGPFRIVHFIVVSDVEDCHEVSLYVLTLKVIKVRCAGRKESASQEEVRLVMKCIARAHV